MILSVWVLACLFILGCSDNLIYKVNEQLPDIVVYPEEINFGSLLSGQESDSFEIVIVNAGDGDLNVFSPFLITENGKFSLEVIGDVSILGGELKTATITYTPETFESNNNIIVIESNDIDSPTLEIPVTGMGDAPVMSVDPVNIDYGDISIGCDNEERVTISNEGNLSLEIESVIQMVTQPAEIILEFGSLPELPWLIEPGMSLDFLVSYIPEDIGLDESEITITSNDPLTPLIESIQIGSGDVEHWFSQTHIQEAVPILDILWVIDDSGSMQRFQTSMSSNVGQFINAFSLSGADYNMAVITTSYSQIGTIVTNNTPNAEFIIANELLVGTHGSGMERGIEMSFNALCDPLSAGQGSDFFRESATLVVVYVSDEPDSSINGWQQYVSFFENIKPPGQFIPYGVIGDSPGGCIHPNSNINVAFGAGYWDIIDYFGGSWYSICAVDWGIQLQDLANSMVSRYKFNLEEDDPIEETIKVYINGQETDKWIYDASLNSVIFDSDSIPIEGETIEIEYAVWGC